MGIRNAKVPKPTTNKIKSWNTKWDKLDDYKIQEEAINTLFKQYPKCNDIKSTIIKCSVLNDFYSTNIFKVYPVAKHITKINNVDDDLKNGELSLVNKIAKVKLGKGNNKTTKHLYSFATKFCHHHNSNFPIYDYYVDEMLRYFRNKYQNQFKFKNDELKNYERFVEILKKFQEVFNLSNFSLKEIDRYLWLAGKRYMPRKYNKKNNKPR